MSIAGYEVEHLQETLRNIEAQAAPLRSALAPLEEAAALIRSELRARRYQPTAEDTRKLASLIEAGR
jgi:hypothetical protein